MKNKTVSLKLISLMLWLTLAFVLFASQPFAQTRNNDFPQERLIQNGRTTNFDKMSLLEKRELFNRLSEAEKLEIFKELSDTEKKVILKGLSDTDKVLIFGSLDDVDKLLVFESLNEVEKERIFENLPDIDKELIFESLSDFEKKEWLNRYPYLESIVKKEKVTPPSPGKAVEPVEEKAPPSRIEKILSGRFPVDISRELRQYGYDFFTKEPIAFEPIINVPVGSDYIIGPGDNFKIHLWGKAEQTYDVTVDRNGQITIPRLGTVSVSGMTYAEMKSHLSHKFKEYYPAFEMSITMGRLRTIQIFLVGEANEPGTYSVSSLSTMVTTLFATGGPGKNGSLRKIQLIRNAKEIKTLDLYDFFLRGDKKPDERLEPGDTLFIPVIGPVVGVAGSVRRPAIYEMSGNQTVGDVIALAGGVLPTGYLQNIIVERIEGHKRRIVKSFNADPDERSSKQEMSTVLKDGDLVKIYPVDKKIRNVVYLEGHVKYPREYEFKPGIRISALIPSYEYLLPEPFLPQAEIVRLVPPDLQPEIVEFNLGKMLAGDKTHDLLLQDLDRVIVYHKWDKEILPQVEINGEVKNPGIFRLYRGMTIKDLIFQAGNLTDKAFQENAMLSRIVPAESGTDVLKLEFSPKKVMAGEKPDNMVLAPYDTVNIREIPQYNQALVQKVHLEGEFMFPGEYSFSEGDKLSSIIERAGGLTEEAYPQGAVFLRESAKEVQKERITEYVSKLEEELLTLGAMAAGVAADKEEAAILRETISTRKQLLNKLKTAKPTGRMVINLPVVLNIPSSEDNFALRSGDRLIVKKTPDFVNVLGEVYNPTALFSEKDKTVEYFLNKVGGLTNWADKGQVYLVKANGVVMSKSQEGFFGLVSWDSANSRWRMGGFDSLKVDPGDTIIAPKKVEKFPWIRTAKDITQILFQIAVAAGVIIAAY